METEQPPAAETEPPRASEFFRLWAVATTVAHGVAGLITMLVYRSIEHQRFISREFQPAPPFLTMLSAGLIALAQRMVLQRAFRESACWGWVLVTALGALAGGTIAEVIRSGCIFGVRLEWGEFAQWYEVPWGIVGLSTGIAQAVHLVRVTGSTRFAWWSGANLAVGLAAGLGSMFCINSVLSAIAGSPGFFSSNLVWSVLSVVLSLLQGAVVGLILGWVLSRWLLRAGRLRRGGADPA